MTLTNLSHAESEALFFLDRARELREAVTENEYDRIRSSKESGALRRASMDLTRALAKLRKANG